MNDMAKGIRRLLQVVGLVCWLAVWAGGCGKGSNSPSRVGSPVRSTGPVLSLEDAMPLPIAGKERITAVAFSPDNGRLLVSLDDRAGRITLWTVALTPGHKLERWGALPGCIEVWSVAWAPSGEDTVALVARLARGEPPVFETSIFTWTKGQEPIRRHTLLEERNPGDKRGENVRLAWPRSDAVCVLRKDGIHLVRLDSGESRRLYQRDETVSVIAALRAREEGVIEFVQYPFEARLTPAKVVPTQLVRLGLDGKIRETTELAAGVGADSPLLSDVSYVYGGMNPTVKAPSDLHSIRLFARDTNRVVHRLPLDLAALGTPRADQASVVFAMAISRDGRWMVCRGGNPTTALEEGFYTVLFELAPP